MTRENKEVRAFFFLLAGVVSTGLALAGCRCGDGRPPGPEPVAVAGGEALEALELTTGGADPDAELPLVLGVHGLGDSPRGFRGLYQGMSVPARVVLPRAPASWGHGFAWFPARYLDGDEQRLAEGIAAAADRVAALIERLVAERSGRGEPIVTGFSQGGMICFALAVRHPEAIRLAVPIGGALPPLLRPRTGEDPGRYPPIRALHGAEDRLVPVDGARGAVEELNAAGLDAELEVFAGVGHAVSPRIRRRLHALLARALETGTP
ncbi:MAG: alpha/beta fold hydrolase [Polyangia bacterium]